MLIVAKFSVVDVCQSLRYICFWEVLTDLLICCYKFDVSLDSIVTQWLVNFRVISFCALWFWPSFCWEIFYLYIFKGSNQTIAEDELKSKQISSKNWSITSKTLFSYCKYVCTVKRSKCMVEMIHDVTGTGKSIYCSWSLTFKMTLWN